MHIVEPEKLLGPLASMIGGPHTLRSMGPAPGDTAQRPEFQGAPFVEADHRRPRPPRLVELAMRFFSDRTRDHWTSSKSEFAGPGDLRGAEAGGPIRR